MEMNLKDRIPLGNGKNNKICIPHLADTTTVEQLVQLLREGIYADVCYNNTPPGEENSGVQQLGTLINANLLETLLGGEIGEIRLFNGTQPGENWLLCDGSFYRKAEYPELFARLEYDTDIVANLKADTYFDSSRTFQSFQIGGLGWTLFASSYNRIGWHRIKNQNNSVQTFEPVPGEATCACYDSGLRKFLFFGRNGHIYIAGPGMVTWEDAESGFSGGTQGRCAYHSKSGVAVFWNFRGGSYDSIGFMRDSTRHYSIYQDSSKFIYVPKMVDLGDNYLYGFDDEVSGGTKVDGRKIQRVGAFDTHTPTVTAMEVGTQTDISDITSAGTDGYWIDRKGNYGTFHETAGTALGQIGTGESTQCRICATGVEELLLGSHGSVLWYMDHGVKKSLMRFEKPIQNISSDGTHIWVADNNNLYTINLLYTTNYFSVPDYRHLPGKFYIKAK